MSSIKSRLVSIVLFIVVFLAGAVFYEVINDESSLEYQIGELEGQVYEYSLQVSSLESSLASNVEELEDLESDYIDLESQFSLLQGRYGTLNDDYDDLAVSYGELDYFLTMLTELRIGNGLTSYYDYIRTEFGPSGTRTLGSYDENFCKFAAQLTLHDIHELYWTDAEEKYGEDVGQTSYEQAWKVLSIAYGYCDIGLYDSDTEKIAKVLEFVNSIITYELELDDSQRAPVETLNLKSGDCDDFSILVAALLELAGLDTGIGYFQNEDSAHAMVLVHMESLEGYRYWFYEDLTDYDMESGRWLKIEPQFTIGGQGDDDWFSQWNLYMGVEVDYEKASG